MRLFTAPSYPFPPEPSDIVALTPAGLLLNSYGAIFGYFQPIIYYYFAIPETPSIRSTSNVPVSLAPSLQASTSVTSFSISDTAANVSAAFDALNGDTKLTAVKLTTSVPLTINAAQFAKDTSVEVKLPSDAPYAISGVTAAAAGAAQADTSIVSFSISDSISNVTAVAGLAGDTKLTAIAVVDTAVDVLANLPTVSAFPRLSSVTLIGGTTLAVTATQYSSYLKTLDLLAPPNRLTVSGASVASGPTLQSDHHVGSFTVSDSASNVLGGLSRLNGDSKLASITLTGSSSVSVTSGQYFTYRVALDKLSSGDTVTVSGIPTVNVLSVAGDKHVTSFSVSDTLSNVGISFYALEAYAKTGELTAINITDTGQTLVLSAAQYAANADAIALLKGSFTLVNGAPPTHLAIKIIWDSSTANAPAAWKSDVQYAVNFLENLITTPITVNLRVGYGESGGYSLDSGTLGEEVGGASTYITASQFKADLQNNVASNPTVQTAIANLAGGSTVLYITGAQEKAFGLLPSNGTEVDASVGFATDPNQTTFAYLPTARAVPGKFDFIGVVEHEISHALGRVSYVGSTTALDLFRYSAPGVLAAAGTASYFSIDGGVTNLDIFAPSGDTGDWMQSAGNDANNAYAPSNSVNSFTAADIIEMNVLGYSVSTTPPNAVSSGSGVSGSSPSSSASTALASASEGLNAPALSFIGTPAAEAFSASVTRLTAALPPASGIEEIAGLRYSLNSLTIDLSGMTGGLEAFDTLVDGNPAIALAGNGDLSHGLVLTGLTSGDTASDLLAHHLSIAGNFATID